MLIPRELITDYPINISSGVTSATALVIWQMSVKLRSLKVKERQVIQRRQEFFCGSSHLRCSLPIESHFEKVVGKLFMTPATITAQTTSKMDDGGFQSTIIKIKGIPVTGIIDTGSDITIISVDLFKKIVADAGFKKEDFKTADKQAYSYNRLLTVLDGQINVTRSASKTRRYTPLCM